MLAAALAYLRAGLCVLPAIRADKRPALSRWKDFQRALPCEKQVETWFANADAICIVCGAVSGHLEILDFDLAGEQYTAWLERVEAAKPGLAKLLVVERSPSGGKHVIYRCAEPVGGNLKLAQVSEPVEGPNEVVIRGKKYKPRKDARGQWHVVLTTIETRGEGGLFLCSPTPGYVLEQGDLCNVPILSASERETLLETAWSLNEYWSDPVNGSNLGGDGNRPGDDYNHRGDVRALLQKHGWAYVRQGSNGNELWRRPGKESSWSASLRDGLFYVFSSNAAPFEPNKSYSPFAVYALLEHGGDFRAATSALRAAGFGDEVAAVDLSCITASHTVPAAEPEPEYPDPGPLPVELCRVPGFISEVMDHCLATAPYPNVPLAFCGALALQAFLAGRKVRDQADVRSNLYILALAHSSVGKDWPRKINAFILHRVGLIDALGDKFASGEGIQDALFRTPAMLFQTDEIDGLLQLINKACDARHENILGTLLTIYSASNSIFPMRRKAGKESPGVIDQPCLVIYGTAIPNHYYEALSERMLTNGFFARMLIIESGTRGSGQEPGIIDPPPRVMETAQWWADFCPGTGNLEKFHPQPRVVEADDDARALLTEARLASEAEYAKCEANSDPVGTTVWGRVPEQIRKLALLYAVSVNCESPKINAAAIRWASEFVHHQTRRMLAMAQNYVADNPFHADCLRLLRKLRESPDGQLPHSVLLKRMKMNAKTFQEVIATLEQQGDLQTIMQTTCGRPQRSYRLCERPTPSPEEGVKELGETMGEG
jgi:hypothetical protein